MQIEAYPEDEPTELTHQPLFAGSFRLLDRIGEGGAGTVWRAEHPLIGARVAIKLLHADLCRNAEALRRFVIEAQAANRIASPHIVRTFDFGRMADGRHYLVMELLEGETLRERLDRCGALPWAEARPILAQLARAVASAHRAGVVHRDLKPENVHLGRGRPHVKVLDFGIAKLLCPEPVDAPLTQAGVFLGTPTYVAPEQALGRPAGLAADLYALGVIAFEVLAGRPPFEGCMQEMLTARIDSPAPSLPRRVNVPPFARRLVERLLASDSGTRATVDDVLVALEPPARSTAAAARALSRPASALDGARTAATTVVVEQTALTAPRARRPAWPGWLPGGLAAATLLALICSAWSATSSAGALAPAPAQVSPEVTELAAAASATADTVSRSHPRRRAGKPRATRAR